MIHRASEMKSTESRDIHLHSAILNELGYDVNPNSVILGFGCRNGKRVREYGDAGFNALIAPLFFLQKQ